MVVVMQIKMRLHIKKNFTRNWLPFCRQHFPIHFQDFFHLFVNFHWIGAIDNNSALVQVKAWNWTGGKQAIPEPMMELKNTEIWIKIQKFPLWFVCAFSVHFEYDLIPEDLPLYLWLSSTCIIPSGAVRKSSCVFREWMLLWIMSMVCYQSQQLWL